MSRAFIFEIQSTHGQRRLWRAHAFANTYPQIAGTYDALRKRLQFRRTNGLLDCGAVIETRHGLLVDVEKFQTWLLKANPSVDDAEFAVFQLARRMDALRIEQERAA